MTATTSPGSAEQPTGLTLFERSRDGRGGGKVPHPPKDALRRIPSELLRTEGPRLPQVSEPELTRHFTNLSRLNYSVDSGFYPLGSCTMKYNPKIDEWAARLTGFAALHPLVPDELAQGTLELLWELEQALAEIGGMKAVTLQPAAGAHGELAGILMVRAYHLSRGDVARTEVLVPDSAHGTNPATASMAGFKTVSIPSAADGGVDIEAFRAALGPRTAAVMITNPSTLGLFEARLCELLEAVHEVGALAYMDGANLNAIMGRFKPGEAGFDVMHFNVHKTFSTPHGGGGPGAGPVGVGERLLPFLPSPRILREADGHFRLEVPGERPSSIGRVRAFVGNTGVLVRAYAYIRTHGASGLREVSDDAVLAANYLKARLAGTLDVPFARHCMHEFVASSTTLKSETGVRTLDVAKRLIDYGFHPPTIYFPLTVDEALLIEPTETESIETLDTFVAALEAIVAEAHGEPELLHSAPHDAPVRRLDETTAARQPNLRWRAMNGRQMPCPD
jgi:glycine dehydrogenase subunit 2